VNKTGENRIRELVKMKMAGTSYSTIRNELSRSGISADEISNIIRQVDEKVLQETTRQVGLQKGKQWYRIGLVLAVAGLALSIAYKRGIIFNSLPALLIYSPFFAGILVMLHGRGLLRKQGAPEVKDPGAIRKRRPYK
jgi:hypothetical protein